MIGIAMRAGSERFATPMGIFSSRELKSIETVCVPTFSSAVSPPSPLGLASYVANWTCTQFALALEVAPSLPIGHPFVGSEKEAAVYPPVSEPEKLSNAHGSEIPTLRPRLGVVIRATS